MRDIDSVNIFGLNISNISYEEFLVYIESCISGKVKRVIGYANADTLNKVNKYDKLKDILSGFDLVHPDGIGVFLASGLLKGKEGLKVRFTGSDIYPVLIDRSIKNNWSYFFFGHSVKILDSISARYPDLKIAGIHEGYNFETDEVIEKINKARPDILIIGLSCPKQEFWISENKDKLNFKTALLVGDGIRIFADKKIRGPVLIRKIGLEWVIRYFTNPIRNFRKYIIGVPLFIFKVLRLKIKP